MTTKRKPEPESDEDRDSIEIESVALALLQFSRTLLLIQALFTTTYLMTYIKISCSFYNYYKGYLSLELG